MVSKTSRAVVGAALGVLTSVSYRAFQRDIETARLRVSAGSLLATTAYGPVEYSQFGQGKPLLVVHGAGGGYDQGLLFARPLADSGFRVTAMSRFGYLRTPLPEDASPRTQADAHASLLDALQIDRTIVIGASAGAPSAMQFAIRHPQRCSALVLLVPLTWKPDDAPDSASRPSRLSELILRSMVGSDALFWLALHLARKALIERVLGTPPAVLAGASSSEQGRVDEVLHSILPLSSRTAGLRNDALIASSLSRYDLESIRAPTLVVSVRDDLYGTFAGAQYTAQHIPGAGFIGYKQGGHLWVGHHQELMDVIDSFVSRADRAQ
ncbi:MAG TPA: alpha/beta hydrolase [Steroidobacteraceae bacterium]|nr:alpha/beta hydrolase [Steroidobacteraceae bacterium]